MEDVHCCYEDDGVKGVENQGEHLVVCRGNKIKECSLCSEYVKTSLKGDCSTGRICEDIRTVESHYRKD